MSRLSLVIADLDRDYLSKLEKFLMVHYPQRFDIFSFSSHGKLSEFLNNPDKRDILLINSILFKRELNLNNIEAVILLKGDGLNTIPDGIDAVSKYQHAELLVTDILRLYAAKSRKGAAVQGRCTTRMICVHSPTGGSGKSSVAAGCSVLCARKGLKTFYLNLEDIPSTQMYFYGDNSQSFSNVIYHLKGKAESLELKLDSAKCCDPDTGVYFFAPPESILDMEELTADDISHLVTGLKASGLYDAVFIDMSAGLNEHNTVILESSDYIVEVLADWDATVMKTIAMQKGMEMLSHKHGTGFSDKVATVLNRCGKSFCSIRNNPALLIRPDIEIPEFTQKIGTGGPLNLVRNTAFLSSLNRLVGHILPYREEECYAGAGGDSVG